MTVASVGDDPPALFAAGEFNTINGTVSRGIACWDGDRWESLGAGFQGPSVLPGVDIVVGFDDGAGPALFALGDFVSVDGVPAPGFARWDGAHWSAVETNIAPPGKAIDRADPPESGPFPFYAATVFDDGSGPALYIAGRITFEGGTVHSVVRWRGGATVESARTYTGSDYPQALAVFDDGSGPALFVSGLDEGSFSSNHIQRFDGTAWSTVPGELNSRLVDAMHVFECGGSALLVLGGLFDGIHNVPGVGDIPGTRAIAAWDGQQWSSIADGIPNGSVTALATFDAGSGPQLFIGGAFSFTTPEGDAIQNIAAPGDSGWTAPMAIESVMPNGVGAVMPFLVGSDPALFIGTPGPISAGADEHQYYRIAAWDGAQLLEPGDPATEGADDGVYAADVVLTLDRPGGPALFVPNLSSAGGVRLDGGGIWDGAQWSALQPGWSSWYAVSGVAVEQPGQHPLVYLLGTFRQQTGGTRYSLVAWDGQSVTGLVPISQSISYFLNYPIDAIACLDEGPQAPVYFGGVLDVDGVREGVARLDDEGAHIVGAADTPPDELGSDSTVWGVAALNDPVHPMVFAFGGFTMMDGQAIPAVAAWDGTSWSDPFPQIGDRVGARVLAHAFEDGHDAIYFNVEHAGNPRPELMRWDGATLSAIPIPDTMRSVMSLAVDTSRSPARLFACTTTEPQNLYVPIDFDLWIREHDRWRRVDLPGGLPATHLSIFDGRLYALGGFWNVGGTASHHIGAHSLDQPFLLLPASCAGDCDLDGDVDLDDFAILAANFATSVPTARASGDLNGDLRVNIADFVILAPNYTCTGE